MIRFEIRLGAGKGDDSTAVARVPTVRLCTRRTQRLRLGSAYRDLGLVFTIPDGGPVNSDNLRNRAFAQLVTLAGVRTIRPHDLRHCYASTLLAAGATP